MVAAGCKNYEDTLIAVHKSHIAQKLPINYFLIDSWWCKCSRSLCVFFRSSKTRLHRWSIEPKPSVSMEMSGGVILPAGLDGTPKRYVVAGHGGSHYPPGRRMVLFQSYDFEAWDSSTVSGFNRVPRAPKVPTGNPDYLYGNAGEQCHLGAGLKARAGVVLGMYGQWHGHPSNDRRLLTMDLGFVVSNDGLHFREPVPDFRMVPCAEDESTLAEEPWTEQHKLVPNVVDFPANVQGNGMENVGDKTLFWYGTWPEVDADGVRCASWDRDRLGYLSPWKGTSGSVTSCPIKPSAAGKVQVSLNLEGTSADATATVTILTEKFAPVPGYTDECSIVTDGLHQTVMWKSEAAAPGAVEVSSAEGESVWATPLVTLPDDAAAGRLRVRVTIGGKLGAGVKLYAIYVADPAEGPSCTSQVPDLYVPPPNADALLAAAEAGVAPDAALAGFEEVVTEDEEQRAGTPDAQPADGNFVAKLVELKELFESEFLTAEEFAAAKAALIPK